MQNTDKNLVVLEFPLNGIEIGCPFDMQPPGTTPVAINVRGLEPLTQRDRGAQRPGLSRYLGRIPTNSVVQFLGFIVDPQADALVAPTDQEDPHARYEYIDDPSSNNFASRNPPGRRIRKGGSGLQINRKKPAGTGTRRTPVIVWADDQGSINYGVPLDGTQLNAAANDPVTGLTVAGTFAYSPASGVILGVGARALELTFTPTDMAAYFPVDDTSTITIVKVDSPYAFGHGTASNAAASASASVGTTSVTMSVNGSSEDPYANTTCTHSSENDGDYSGDYPSIGSPIGIEWFATNQTGPIVFPSGGNFYWTYRAS